MKRFVFVGIILLGLLLRLQNVDWDQGQHLHPDERFLTMVTDAMRVPTTFAQYYDQKTSLLNPNNIGYRFFVYGTWPLIITKYVAQFLTMDSYGGIYIVGRILSAIVDTINIALIFLLIYGLERHVRNRKSLTIHPHIKYFAAYVYAVMVLPIQQAHFYTTDTFSNTFIFSSLTVVIWGTRSNVRLIHRIFLIILAGMCAGMGIASKINAVYSFPLLCAMLVIPALFHVRQYAGRTIGLIVIFVSVTYLTLRMTNPYYFEHTSFISPQLSTVFTQNIKELQRLNDPEGWFPPGVQWITKQKIVFPLQNLILFGLGLPITILSLMSIVRICMHCAHAWHLLIKKKVVRLNELDIVLGAIIGWMTIFFIYQGTQFAHTMRYFLPLYPLLACFAGGGIWICARWCRGRVYSAALFGVLLILVGVWAYMFSAIYWRPQSRVAASHWMWEHMPAGSKIAWEHWDDPLPLQVPHDLSKQFAPGIELPVFGPDTPEKWKEITQKLTDADYYVLSSNRAWGSTVTVPKRYPQQKEFYKKLFADQYRGYRKVYTGASYPGLCLPFRGDMCFFHIPDQWAEEAFTVYDHPLVLIYKNTRL